MFGMGMTEILVILVIALLFLGPEKLPEAAKQLSKGIRDLRKQTREFQDTIENDTQIGGAIRDIKSALRGDEIRRPPVRKPPPVKTPEELAALAAANGLAASALDQPRALDGELPIAPATDPLAASGDPDADAEVAHTEDGALVEPTAAGVAAELPGASVIATETIQPAADVKLAAADTTATPSDGDPDAGDPDGPADEPGIATIDDELAKMIRPPTGAIGRGRPN